MGRPLQINHFKTASDEATSKLLAHTFCLRMISCERAGRARGRDDWTKEYSTGLASRPTGRANWGTNDREQETMSAFCLQKPRSLTVSAAVLRAFYRSCIESVLTFSFLCRSGGLDVNIKNVLNCRFTHFLPEFCFLCFNVFVPVLVWRLGSEKQKCLE